MKVVLKTITMFCYYLLPYLIYFQIKLLRFHLIILLFFGNTQNVSYLHHKVEPRII